MFLHCYHKTFILIVINIIVSAKSDYVEVKTTEGIVVSDVNSENYYEFYGIPYGGDTSGKYRFKNAPPPLKYEKFVADKRDLVCAQPSPDGPIGVEDCLTLNIYTRNISNPKPVIVWLNGEEYSRNNYTPRYTYGTYVFQDIVFVEVNYRLSIFGFLCLGVEDAPGNAGLKDVVQALRWVNKNIKGFGGDPENVVLLGHGSGAAMVDLVTMSDQTDSNLVHKAVALSGSALSPWAIAYDPKGYAENLGLKFNIQDMANLAKYFQKMNVSTLVKGINSFDFTNQSVLFAPCIENKNIPDPFLSSHPLIILRSGEYKQIPYIAGYASQEGSLTIDKVLHNRWLERMQENFTDFLPMNLAFNDTDTKLNISDYIRESYFGDNYIFMNSTERFFAYEGDSLIKYPVIRGVTERAKTSKSPVYLLYFDVNEGFRNDWPYQDIPLKGTGHGRILEYIFDSDVVDKTSIKKSLINRVVAFAKTGVVVSSDSFDGTIAWYAVTNESLNYLKMSGDNNIFYENPLVNPEITMSWDPIYDSYLNQLESTLLPRARSVSATSSICLSLFAVLFCIWGLIS